MYRKKITTKILVQHVDSFLCWVNEQASQALFCLFDVLEKLL